MKDYGKLRPFDLEAAKAGEKFVGWKDLQPRKFVAGPDKSGWLIIEDDDGGYHFGTPTDYRLAPLAWVHKSLDEDVLWPVYKGDVLYAGDKLRTASGLYTDDDGDTFLTFVEDGFDVWISGPHGGFGTPLTFTPPKVKREGWIAIKTAERPNAGDKYTHWCSHICATEKLARDHYGPSTSVVVAQVSFEEPAGQEGSIQ